MLNVNDLPPKTSRPDAVIAFGIRQRLANVLAEEQGANIEAQKARLLRYVAELKRHAGGHRHAGGQSSSTTRCRPASTSFALGKHLKYSSGYWLEETTTLMSRRPSCCR